MAIELGAGVVIAGRYRLEGLLGQGGMGAVWAATHLITRRKVALKFVHGPAHARPELCRRFLREARAASAVQHPNVLGVVDVFELDESTPVMVMELLNGETLRSKLAREAPLSMEETASIMLPVVSAVGTAHALGIVHRDLKPDNVFLAIDEEHPDGERHVKVLDFGIAKLAFVGADAGATGVLTGAGVMLGTPGYMAPEQALGERDIDGRADGWAIGVMLYEALSGGRPIEGDSVAQVVARMMSSSIAPLELVSSDVPDDVAALVDRLLSRDRAKRPEDLRDVMRVLRRYTPVTAREFGPAAIMPPEPAREAVEGPVALAPSASFDPPVAEGVLGVDGVGAVHPAIGPQPPETLASIETARPSLARPSLRVLSVVVPLVLGVTVALAWAWQRPRSTPVAAVATAASSPPPEDPPVSTDPEAARLFHEGMRVLRARSIAQAVALWHEASTRDPTLAAALLRTALYSFVLSGDGPRARAAFREAIAHRSKLSTRDRALADAAAPLFDDPSDLKAADTRLEALARADTANDEPLIWRGVVGVKFIRDLPTALADFDEASRRDPSSALALYLASVTLKELGRSDEAQRRVEQCVTLHPDDWDCEAELLLRLSDAGKCAELEQQARHWQTVDPTNSEPALYLAKSLAFRRGAPEAIDEALASVVLHTNDASERSKLEHINRLLATRWAGDFVAAQREALELDGVLVAHAASFEQRARFGWRRVELQIESGDVAGAKASARRMLAAREGSARMTTGPDLDDAHFQDFDGLLRDERRDDWDRFTRERAAQLTLRRDRPTVERWAFWGSYFAIRPMTPDDARAAVAAAGELHLAESASPIRVNFDLGLAFALAGDSESATRYLRISLSNCKKAPEDPWGWMQARLALAKLGEADGDKAEARALYQVIVDAWGNARPRSVTAEEARRRLARL